MKRHTFRREKCCWDVNILCYKCWHHVSRERVQVFLFTSMSLYSPPPTLEHSIVVVADWLMIYSAVQLLGQSRISFVLAVYSNILDVKSNNDNEVKILIVSFNVTGLSLRGLRCSTRGRRWRWSAILSLIQQKSLTGTDTPATEGGAERWLDETQLIRKHFGRRLVKGVNIHFIVSML